ncbi:uncharacterized protein V6R79_007814 [Siganus canaliculatus]
MAVLPLRVKMLRQVWRLKGIVILVCSPFILLPLAISTTEAACAYVIALMALYWCTEVLPLAVTALLPTILFPVLGIMESKDVCMQYLKDTNMLFVGGLMVAVAVEHWNLHKRIALRVLLVIGVRPALLMLGFMGVTAFLSMWISNTATTAMMVPIVQAILDQLNGQADPESPSKSQTRSVLIHQENEEKSSPEKGLNGGSLAQDNTQDNAQDNASSEQKMLPEMTTQDVVKPRPQEKAPSGSQDSGPAVVSVENVCFQMELEELSEEDEERKQMSKGLLLCVCYAASIGGIATLTGTGPNLVLVGQMNQLFPQNGDVINFASWFVFAFPIMALTLTLAWFWLQFLYIGCNLRKTWGCGAAQSEKERAAYEVIRDEHRRLGPMSYGEFNVLALFLFMVVLWFTRDPRFMDGWATHMFNSQAEFVTDATVSLFVAVLLFVLPSEPPYFLCFWRSSDAVEGVPRPRPSAAHLAGDSEEDALEHRAAAGRRLRSGQRQRGVRSFSLARHSDDSTPLHPSMGHRHHPLPPHRHVHRVRQQRRHSNAFPSHPGVHVSVHTLEPSVRDDSLHAQLLLRLHVASGHAPQRHRFLLWSPQGLRHGQIWRGDEHHWHRLHHSGHQQLGACPVWPGFLSLVGQCHCTCVAAAMSCYSGCFPESLLGSLESA